MGDTITVKGIMEFFGMKASEFMKDWRKSWGNTVKAENKIR